ncbi:MAG: AAA family ATPase [Clostridia bacterium]|nr:AAA family ATPase [Clostridia bacterium]
MAVNSQYNLIVVRGEDKTASILSWEFNSYKPVVFITYNNGKSYPYNTNEVLFLKNPKNISVFDKLVFCKGSIKTGVKNVQIFDSYCRICYTKGYSEIYFTRDVKIIDSALKDKKSRNCFNYLKDIAVATGLTVNNHNILATHYDKIDFIRDDSVMASFLSGKRRRLNSCEKGTIIYPFGFNISQGKAVDNALKSDISIIEGPPGTGKTQTILNIIANAVMRGESVAVVSSNNSATENVYDKLKKYGIEFIVAPLGSTDNKNVFISGQTTQLPDISKWGEKPSQLLMSGMIKELNAKLKSKNELSFLLAEEDALIKEKAHFDDYYKTLTIDLPIPQFSKKVSAKQILAFSAEYEYLLSKKSKISFFKKLILRFSYGLKKIDFFGTDFKIISAYCQNLFYERRLIEIAVKRKSLEEDLRVFDFDKKISQYTNLSMQLFKHTLYNRYSTSKRRVYTVADLWQNTEDFIADYPVILSTTYSLRSSLSSKTIYDYVIIDEASQVDLVTGALALSCAKKTVIVGDLKQLPNVVNREQKLITDNIYSKYNLPSAYKFSDHSLLSSVIELFPDVPRVLLKEHYRCHPEIIGFCNQKFYNNELIILTKPKSDCQALMVYKTVAGNVARGHINERQIDVIRQEVILQQKLNISDGSVGIVTPYRYQADRLQEEFSGTSVKADTADKFQGQERSVMIFSTVDNQIGEFASDPNRLNVAVSRAIDQFIVVTDGNDNDKVSPIHELIEYIKYHNHEIIDSKINSVFDYLYEANAEARESILRKYGRASEFDSENLMLILIKDILKQDNFSTLNVVMHVPLRSLLCDLSQLNLREVEFATNHLTHVDFLIFSKLTHQPILVIEVDGFAYHNTEKQRRRDILKDGILNKYGIPILRLSTTGSGEREKINSKLAELVNGVKL